jgi:hypothetical protein
MYAVMIESYEEFKKRNSGTVQIDGHQVATGPLPFGGEFVFSTGARVDASNEAARQEAPPAGTIESIAAKLLYWRCALRVSESDFANLRREAWKAAEMSSRYANLPGPSRAMLDGLPVLQKMVFHARGQVAQLEKELADRTAADPAVQRRRFMEANEVREQTAASQLMAEIESITI